MVDNLINHLKIKKIIQFSALITLKKKKKNYKI